MRSEFCTVCLSLHPVGPRNHTQLSRCAWEGLSWLSHLTDVCGSEAVKVGLSDSLSAFTGFIIQNEGMEKKEADDISTGSAS